MLKAEKLPWGMTLNGAACAEIMGSDLNGFAAVNRGGNWTIPEQRAGQPQFEHRVLCGCALVVLFCQKAMFLWNAPSAKTKETTGYFPCCCYLL